MLNRTGDATVSPGTTVASSKTDLTLEITDLVLGYGGSPVVTGFELSVSPGTFTSLLGPSGCGKSTILRAVAGFLAPMQGRIVLGGKDITSLAPERRDVGIVFQNYALFPTMTAFENIAFGLRAAGTSKAKIDKSVGEIASIVGISAFLDRKPANLSGGQQQRVAIARALVMAPRILLFDEPLSNLDAKVRQTMRREIKRLQRDIGFTAIFVTHDQEEALSMSDSIVVLNEGRIEQSGPPRMLYQRPQTPFIAKFIGASNELSPEMARELAGVSQGRCFVRHEDLFLADSGLPATVLHTEFLGTTTRIDLGFKGSELSVLSKDADAPEIGATVFVAMRPGTAHVFSEAIS